MTENFEHSKAKHLREVAEPAKRESGLQMAAALTLILLFIGAYVTQNVFHISLALAIGAVWAIVAVSDGLGNMVARDDTKNQQMPDDWLQRVAAAPDASQEGLAFLAKCLANKGFVTVQQAMQWSAIEQQAATFKQQKAEGLMPGATALLARAQAECGSLLSPSILE